MNDNVVHKEGFFPAKDNLRLYWQSFTPPAPKAHVGVLHGYGDHSGRYRFLFDALVAAGYAVHALDYRGHGQADGRRGHCDRFEEYLEDVNLWLGRVRSEVGSKRLFLFGHSFGGLLLGALALQRPEGVAGAIFASPYLRLAIVPPAFKLFLAKSVGKVLPWLPMKNELKIEQLTHDHEVRAATERDPLYNRTVTPRWFTESTKAQEEVLRRASELVLPALVLVPEEDTIAAPAAMGELYEKMTGVDRTIHRFAGGSHELCNEVPELRAKVFERVVAWLDLHAS